MFYCLIYVLKVANLSITYFILHHACTYTMTFRTKINVFHCVKYGSFT